MPVSHEEYKSILQGQLNGDLTIMIDTSGFRQLFFEADRQRMEQLIGRCVRAPLIAVRILTYTEFLPFFLALGLAVPAFGWWSIGILPAFFLVWVGYKMHASRGRQSILGASLLFLGAMVLAIGAGDWSVWLRLFVLSAASALLATRLLYFVTSTFAFGLIHSSYAFFNSFYLEPEEALIPLIWTRPEVGSPDHTVYEPANETNERRILRA